MEQLWWSFITTLFWQVNGAQLMANWSPWTKAGPCNCNQQQKFSSQCKKMEHFVKHTTCQVGQKRYSFHKCFSKTKDCWEFKSSKNSTKANTSQENQVLPLAHHSARIPTRSEIDFTDEGGTEEWQPERMFARGPVNEYAKYLAPVIGGAVAFLVICGCFCYFCVCKRLREDTGYLSDEDLSTWDSSYLSYDSMPSTYMSGYSEPFSVYEYGQSAHQ